MARSRPLAHAALLTWLVGSLAIGGALTALHDLPLPTPRLARAEAGPGFRLLHAVAAACPCSRRIMDYLAGRGAVTDERILLVGEDAPRAAALRARGFDVLELDEERLGREFGIRGAPSLVVLRPDGTPAYQGAYAPRPQMDPIDLRLLAEARQGTSTASMPILGCAVGRALQGRLDPLGLKYGWR